MVQDWNKVSPSAVAKVAVQAGREDMAVQELNPRPGPTVQSAEGLDPRRAYKTALIANILAAGVLAAWVAKVGYGGNGDATLHLGTTFQFTDALGRAWVEASLDTFLLWFPERIDLAHPPLGFFIGALCCLLLGKGPAVVLLPNILAYALLALPLHRLVRRLSGIGEAWYAVALLPLLPPIAAAMRYCQLDLLLAAWVTLFFQHFLAPRPGSSLRRRSASLVFIAILGLCTKPAFLLCTVPLVLLVVFAQRRRHPLLFRTCLVGAGVLGLGGLYFFAPFLSLERWRYHLSPEHFPGAGWAFQLLFYPWYLLKSWTLLPAMLLAAGLYVTLASRRYRAHRLLLVSLGASLVLLTAVAQKRSYYLLPCHGLLVVAVAHYLTTFRGEWLRRMVLGLLLCNLALPSTVEGPVTDYLALVTPQDTYYRFHDRLLPPSTPFRLPFEQDLPFVQALTNSESVVLRHCPPAFARDKPFEFQLRLRFPALALRNVDLDATRNPGSMPRGTALYVFPQGFDHPLTLECREQLALLLPGQCLEKAVHRFWFPGQQQHDVVLVP